MKYFKDMLSKLANTQQEKSMPPQLGIGEQKYVIHHNGQPITEPKTFKQITQDHGNIKDIEKNPNLRVMPHKPESTSKPPPLPKLTKPMGKNQDIKIPKKEFIKEHKRLIDVLESTSHKDDLKEAKEQRKELKQQISKAEQYFQNLKKKLINKSEEFDILEKGAKELKAMYGSSITPEQENFVGWATSKLPNGNWQEWAVKNHAKNPKQFTAKAVKNIEHFAGSKHIPNIAKVRFDKHDIKQGLEAFKTAEDEYNKKALANPQLIKPSKKTTKFMDVGDNYAWYMLNKPACEAEGAAMGHCGNVPSKKKGQNVLSLRKEVKIGNKTYHEPVATFILQPDGKTIGEMKGRANLIPQPKYHKYIKQLLERSNLLPKGGGYLEGNNFHLDDLSHEDHDDLLAKRPELAVHSRRISPEQQMQLAKNPKNHEMLAENPNLHPEAQNKLAQSQDAITLRYLATNPNLHPELQNKLSQSQDKYTLQNLAENPNLHPEAQNKLAQSQDKGTLYRLAENPNLHPELQMQLAKNPKNHEMLATNPNLHPELQNKLSQSKDVDTLQNLATNPNLHPELQNKLSQSQDAGTLYYLATNPNLHPEAQNKLAQSQDKSTLYNLATNPNLHPELQNKLSQSQDVDTLYYLARNPKIDKQIQKQVLEKLKQLNPESAEEINNRLKLEKLKAESDNNAAAREARIKDYFERFNKSQNYFQNLKKTKKYIAVVHKGMLSDGKYNPTQLFYIGDGLHMEEPYHAMTFNSIEQGMKHFQKEWQSRSQDKNYKETAPHPFDVSFIEDFRPGKWNEDESYYEDESGNPILNADGSPFHPKMPEVEVVKPGSVNIHVNNPQNDYENQLKQKLATNLRNQGKKVNLTYPKMPEQEVKRQTYEEAIKEIAEQQKIQDLRDEGYSDQEIDQLKVAHKEKTKASTKLAASEKYFENLKKGSRQRKMPVDPNKESQMNAMIIDDWQNKQYTPTRGLIKPLTGNLRNRALHKLSGLTKVRRAKDGKREYLLYRGVSDSEKNSVLDDKSINYPENTHTSWSPHQGIAGRFANKGMGHVLGAWIHEDNIHHYPRMTGNVYERHKGSKIKSPNDYAGEDEIIVKHTRPHEGYATHSFSDKSNKLEFNANSPIENKIKSLLEKPKIAAKLAASEKYFQNLKKTPIIQEQEEDFADRTLNNNAFNPKIHENLIYKKLNKDLFYHRYNVKNEPNRVIHSISKGHPGIPISIIVGNVNKDNENEPKGFYATYTATKKEHQGKGLGTKLKHLAAVHHKQILSDAIVSPSEQKSWKNLGQKKNIKIKMGNVYEGNPEINEEDAAEAANFPNIAIYKPKKKIKINKSQKYFENLKKSNEQNQLLKCYFLSKLKKIDGVTTTTMPTVTSPSQTGPSLNGTSLKEQPKGAKGDVSPAGQVSQSFQSNLGMPAVRGAARRIMSVFDKKENK